MDYNICTVRLPFCNKQRANGKKPKAGDEQCVAIPTASQFGASAQSEERSLRRHFENIAESHLLRLCRVPVAAQPDAQWNPAVMSRPRRLFRVACSQSY